MTSARELGSSLGVMQGRLSPMIFGAYQAFPADVWHQEFRLASERSLQHIEWVLDAPSLENNPLLVDPTSIKCCSEETGIRVVSVCADFLMDAPLDVNTPGTWTHFDQLLNSLDFLEASYVVIPCVDQSSLSDPTSQKRLLRAMRELSGRLRGGGVQVALETDLPPVAFRRLLEELDPELFGVNYDIGNSASLGFDPFDELANYGHRVNLLHVKDRKLHGSSVRLGTGSANLKGVLLTLVELEFDGPVTLQCFRDHEGVAVFDEQLETYRCLIRELLNGS